MKNFKIHIIWVSVVMLFLFIAAYQKPVSKLAKDTRPSLSAKLVEVQASSNEHFSTISGKIQAENEVNVSSRIMGYITHTTAKVGDKVWAGQTLVSIDNTDIKAKITQVDASILEAKTNLQNVEKDFARIQSLFEKQSATQKELDDISMYREIMKAKIKQAEATRKQINTQLSYSKVKAPLSGIITDKFVQKGDLASLGQALYRIESNKNFQVEALLPESKIAQIKKGQEVKVVIKSTGQELKGYIAEFSSSSKHTGGQYLTKINLDKKDSKKLKLFSGMYVTVKIPKKAEKGLPSRVMIHKDVIVRQGQLTGIYTLSTENTAILRWLRLGKTYGNQIEVLSGLSLGESYLTDANGRLSNGVKIEIKK